MSGFVGYINFGNRKIDPGVLAAMLKNISHRGFSKEGVFQEERFAVVHINSEGSVPTDKNDQPIINHSGMVTLAYDGEIYNYLELRQALEENGFVFKSDSDTEVIFNSYIQWGIGCLNKFNGIFALCIFDKRSGVMILARDHLGVRPLYFYRMDKSLIFASEIKALLASGLIDKKIDYEALSDYFSFGFVAVPKTLVSGIERLAPGQYLNYQENVFEKVQYWDAVTKNYSEKKRDNYYEEKLLYLMEDSINKRLKGNSAKGILLSGGIDSSALTYFITKHIPDICTFSIGFNGKENVFDENRIYASSVAKEFGTQHKDIILEPNKIDIEQLKKITWFNDDLQAYPCIIAEFFLSRFAGENVHTIFDGTGVEQILGGLDTDKADKILHFYKILPSRLKNYLAECISKKLIVRDRTPEDFIFRLKRFLYGARFSPEVAHFKWREIFSEQEKMNLIRPSILKRMNSRTPLSVYQYYYQNIDYGTFLEKFLYADQKIILETLLKRLDAVYSASGLLARFPYIDYRLVELCAELPPGLKLNGLTTKYIFKKIMKGRLPSRIINRKKRGLTLPLNHWIKNDWRKLINEILFSSSLTGTYFNTDAIKRLLLEHYNNNEDNSWKIFGLISFYLWVEIYDIDIEPSF